MFAFIRPQVIAPVACILLLSACQSTASIPLPARRVAQGTDAQCIAQMQTAIQTPGGSPVALTRAAFAMDDRLTIVPSESVLDASGQPASGRLLGMPDSFRLTLYEGVCNLVRETDAMKFSLPACTCVPIRKQ